MTEEKVEAPPGFEPGVEVLQSHPRCLLALSVRVEFSRKSLSVKTIALVQAIGGKCFLLAEIGAVGSPRAQFRAQRLQVVAEPGKDRTC